MRWAIEVTFHDSKQHLGFEQPQGWPPKAAERTAPLAMLLYTLIVLWFHQAGRRLYKPIDRPWYRHKTHPSFADMLTTLKQTSVKQEVLATRLTGRGSQKPSKPYATSYRWPRDGESRTISCAVKLSHALPRSC